MVTAAEREDETPDSAWVRLRCAVDGSAIAFLSEQGIHVVSATGGKRRTLLKGKTDEDGGEFGYTTYSSPRSHDGHFIAVAATSGATEWVVILKVRNRRVFTSDNNIYNFEWTADGSLRSGEDDAVDSTANQPPVTVPSPTR